MKFTSRLRQIPLLLFILSLGACGGDGDSGSVTPPSLKNDINLPAFDPANSTAGPGTDGTSSVTATLVAGGTNVHTVTITNYGTARLYTTSDLDTVCSLTDANNVELANDDDSGNGLNCSITFDLSPGTYYFVVWGYSSSIAGDYTASLQFTPLSSTETEPNDTVFDADMNNPIGLETKTGTVDTTTDYDDVFTFSPPVSGNYSATLTGFAGDLDLFIMDSTGTPLTGSYTAAFGGSETVSFYMTVGQTYYITAEAWDATNDSYSLTLSSMATQNGTPETEPNNSTAEANVANIGIVTGVVDSTNDYADVFVFTPTVSDNYTIVLSGFNNDLDLYLTDFAGVLYASSSTRVSGGNESITYSLQAGQSYYLTVEGWSAVNDNYALSIETQTTAAPVASAEFEPNNTTANANGVGIGTVTGAVDNATDQTDIFAFTPTKSGGYSMTVTGFTGDIDLILTDDLGNTYTSSTSAALGGSETVSWYMQAGQTYYLNVNAWNATNDNYSLTITAL